MGKRIQNAFLTLKKPKTKECLQAFSKFPNGKSPREDGLSAEFYKKVWPLLGQLLTDFFDLSYECGELSNSQRHRIIKVIEKKGRDRRYVPIKGKDTPPLKRFVGFLTDQYNGG